MRLLGLSVALGGVAFAASCLVRNYERCRADAPCLPSMFCDCSNMDPDYGLCVAAKGDGFLECVGPTLDMTGGGTDGPTGCTDSSQCTNSAAPICRAQTCSACNPSSDDGAGCRAHNVATPRCDGNGRCVACLPGATAPESGDCGSAMPICEGGACRPCQANTECGSGVCKGDGTCANAMTEVVYVDNKSGCQAAGPGTKASPFCEVQPAALAAILATKPYVVVAGSATAYATPVNLTATASPIGPLTIIGPGWAAATTARIQPSVVAPALLVSTNGNPATVIVDGLELSGPGAAGVRCQLGTGAASLTLRNSSVKGSGGVGVDANGCTISIDSSVISANGGGGIKLASATYVITNTIIASNGSSAATAGVSFDNSSNGTFAFNTITRNIVSAGVGGLDCGSGATKAIINSIVWGNTTASGTQIGAQCMLTNVVTALGDDTRGSMNTLAPSFVSATDFHLKANDAANVACCIDKVVNPTTPNNSNDVDGPRKRPQGASWDIGAHELTQ